MELSTAYEMLGVTSNTSEAGVRSAYLARVKIAHPDRSPDDLRIEAGRVMVQLNEARALVLADVVAQDRDDRRNPGKQGKPRGAKEPQPEPPPKQFRPPNDNECEGCGTAPAAAFELRHVTGLLLAWRWTWVPLRVCRQCGRALYAEAQAHCLIRGWWGLFAWAANLAALATNRVTMTRHLRRTRGTATRSDEVSSAIPFPAPRRTAWRPAALISTALAVVIIGSLLTAWVHDHLDSGSTEVSRAPAIGTCVDRAGKVVKCSDSDAAFVMTKKVDSIKQCAGYPDAFTSDGTGETFCAVIATH